MLSKKNIILGKFNFINIVLIFFLFLVYSSVASASDLEGKFLEIKILDKVSSKNTTLNLKIGEEKKFQNLIIKSLKCKNSEFDDNPDITAYLQVKDLNNDNNDKVFIFNGWTFASSPSLQPFDHPVYDIWLTKFINSTIFSLSSQETLKFESINFLCFRSFFCKSIVVSIPSITNSSRDLYILCIASVLFLP